MTKVFRFVNSFGNPVAPPLNVTIVHLQERQFFGKFETIEQVLDHFKIAQFGRLKMQLKFISIHCQFTERFQI